MRENILVGENLAFHFCAAKQLFHNYWSLLQTLRDCTLHDSHSTPEPSVETGAIIVLIFIRLVVALITCLSSNTYDIRVCLRATLLTEARIFYCIYDNLVLVETAPTNSHHTF